MPKDRQPILWPLLFESIASLTLGFALLGLFERTTAGLVFAFGLYLMVSGVIALGQMLVARPRRRIELSARIVLGVLAAFLIFVDEGRLLAMLPTAFNALGESTLLMRLTGALGVAIGLTGIIQMVRGGGWIAGLIGLVVEAGLADALPR